eukprot:TRINITY_DN3861_c0_g4_i1.p1 TRINITY_DN3861_c0_g4~~TRINITY_DN3861_c0_g4_i1.p1  ORF type:complete len:377 (+),score=20.72 TRINITY_DN3861_c0_g4_i1:61-1191(+)
MISAQDLETWSNSTNVENQQQEEELIDVVSDTTSNSESYDSDEFELERFRNQSQQMTSLKSISIQPINQDLEEKGENVGQKKNINILGFELQLEYLKERHKDPILLLKTMAFFYSCGGICQLVTMVFGSGYDLVLSIVGSLHIVSISLFSLVQLQYSLKDGIKIRKRDIPYILLFISGYTTIIIYSFIVKVPFNSMPLFLLTLYAMGFFFLTLSACASVKNNIPKNDPNYQLRFFVKRAMLGILNSTSIIDVLSDVALGVQIIQKYHGFLRYIGIVLFFCCLLDFLIVNIRIVTPGKVTIVMHTWAIVLEIFIIISSILAAVKIKDENVDWEFVLLLVFSLVSTLINFLHHIFVVVEWQLTMRQKHTPVTFVEFFE